jgi:hypothetical protein
MPCNNTSALFWEIRKLTPGRDTVPRDEVERVVLVHIGVTVHYFQVFQAVRAPFAELFAQTWFGQRRAIKLGLRSDGTNDGAWQKGK